MEFMTFSDLKARILNTSYLPLWLRGGIATVQPTTIAPNIEPAPEGAPRWCPFTRGVNAFIKEDGTSSGSKVAKNRTVYFKRNEANTLAIVGTSIEASYCLGDRCQMWTGSDCGMKNPLLHVKEAVAEAQAFVVEQQLAIDAAAAAAVAAALAAEPSA